MGRMRWLGYWAAVLFVMVSLASGCSSDRSSGDGSTPVSKDGATVTSPDPALANAKIVIPPGAVEEGQVVNVKMEAVDTLPGVVPANGTQAGKVIVLSKSTTTDFSLPVTVTVPYDKNAGDVPAVYYWDATNQQYQAVAVSGIDTTAGLVTFSTVHFSNYVLIQAKNLTSGATALPTVDTLFRPNADGFFHPNFGSYSEPGGSSLGMSDFSIWYYNCMKNSVTTGLYNKYREGDVNLFTDDVTAQTLITKLQMAVANQWKWEIKTRQYELSTNLTGLVLIGAMQVTGKPQTLIMKSVDSQGQLLNAQAVAVYKFTPSPGDPTAGTFTLYDPGFRGEEVTIQWSMQDGFSNYSKAAAFSTPFNRFMFSAPSSISENAKFRKLYTDAEAAFTGASFATIDVTTPAFDTTGIYSYAVTDPNSISIPVSGKVTGGNARYLIWSLNSGTPKTVALATDGSFAFTITDALGVTNTLSLYATDDPANKIGASGYRKLTIKTTGQSVTFLTNGGFETNDTTGWVVETHRWQDSTFDFTGSPVPTAPNYNPDYGMTISFTPNTITPGKSAVVSSGFDPFILGITGNTTSLAMTQFGSRALRVNNDDNSYHISSATQTGTIPATTVSNQFVIRWAAVLEDPQHPYEDQPFVEVVVTDLDSNSILYKRHFFTNDPRYTGGWITLRDSNGIDTGWKMIDWQFGSVDISQSKGHRVKVQVIAGDCNQGGHGGYAFVDIEE